MRERFQSLAHEQQDILRALKLLTAAGILPLTHVRLEAVLKHVFHRTVHLSDCFGSLTAQSFIRRSADQEYIQPEPAYLQGAVAYTSGRTPQNDFPLLRLVLEAMGDIEGLFYQGNTYQTLGDQSGQNAPLQDAVTTYRTVINEWTRERVPLQWATTQNNLGNALAILGQRKEDASIVCDALDSHLMVYGILSAEVPFYASWALRGAKRDVAILKEAFGKVAWQSCLAKYEEVLKPLGFLEAESQTEPWSKDAD